MTGNDQNTFNTKNLSTTIENLDTKLGQVKSKLEDAYKTFAGELRANWNGKDEEAFEEVIQKNLEGIYTNCFNLKEDTAFYMTEAVRHYEIFQDVNRELFSKMSAGEDVSAETVSGYQGVATTEEYTKKTMAEGNALTYDPSGARTYDEGTPMGLVNDSSGSNMTSAAEEFKKTVKSAIDDFKNAQDDSQQIFHSTKLGSENGGSADLGINKLLGVVADSMVVFVKDIQDFMDDYIPILVDNYIKRSKNINDNTSGETGAGDDVSATTAIKNKVMEEYGDDAYSGVEETSGGGSGTPSA